MHQKPAWPHVLLPASLQLLANVFILAFPSAPHPSWDCWAVNVWLGLVVWFPRLCCWKNFDNVSDGRPYTVLCQVIAIVMVWYTRLVCANVGECQWTVPAYSVFQPGPGASWVITRPWWWWQHYKDILPTWAHGMAFSGCHTCKSVTGTSSCLSLSLSWRQYRVDFIVIDSKQKALSVLFKYVSYTNYGTLWRVESWGIVEQYPNYIVTSLWSYFACFLFL